LIFLGVWGTDIEIFSAILLLSTSIYDYSTDSKSWQLFNRYMDLGEKILNNEKCIYLQNNNLQYDVVTDI